MGSYSHGCNIYSHYFTENCCMHEQPTTQPMNTHNVIFSQFVSLQLMQKYLQLKAYVVLGPYVHEAKAAYHRTGF